MAYNGVRYRLHVRVGSGEEYNEYFGEYDDMEASVREWMIEALHFNYSINFAMYEGVRILRIGTLSSW